MTRRESVKKTIDDINDMIKKGVVTTETLELPILMEIAVSLAVIADKMSEADEWE